MSWVDFTKIDDMQIGTFLCILTKFKTFFLLVTQYISNVVNIIQNELQKLLQMRGWDVLRNECFVYQNKIIQNQVKGPK